MSLTQTAATLAAHRDRRAPLALRHPGRPSRVVGRGPARRAVSRAATMIEFAIILPIFLFMMLFTIDMGSVMLMSGAMNDATFATARVGAQVGGGGVDPTIGVVCPDRSACTTSTAGKSFLAGVDQIPFSKSLFDHEPLMLEEGAVCRQDTSGTNPGYVKVRADYSVRLITPGLSSMLNLMSGQNAPELTGYELTAVGVARCEVFRAQD